MTELLIRGGWVVGEAASVRADVHVRDGVIVAVGEDLEVPDGARVIEAEGSWVGPGFVDLHTHLREPGGEAAETVASGARAAAVGGFTAIVAMPNTEPAIDSVDTAAYVLSRGRHAVVDVAVAGAITVGRRGEHLAPMAELAALGVRLFTDDGAVVQDAAVMRRALVYARPLGVRLAQHAEDASLADPGQMNEGPVSSRLGLIGRPTLAEDVIVARDIELVRATGAPLHFLHLSSARALALVEAARAEGLPITAEVTPHHLSLDESACVAYDATYKVNPPLRGNRDVAAVRDALRRGVVDAVATDHAPHAPETKDRPFDEAPSGVLGLEHAAALVNEVIGDDPVRLFAVLSREPARIAQLRGADARVGLSAHGGAIVPGEDANLVVFDPEATWVANREILQSRARNTPYHGRQLRGRVRTTVVRGEVVVHEGEVQ